MTLKKSKNIAQKDVIQCNNSYTCMEIKKVLRNTVGGTKYTSISHAYKQIIM